MRRYSRFRCGRVESDGIRGLRLGGHGKWPAPQGLCWVHVVTVRHDAMKSSKRQRYSYWHSNFERQNTELGLGTSFPITVENLVDISQTAIKPTYVSLFLLGVNGGVCGHGERHRVLFFSWCVHPYVQGATSRSVLACAHDVFNFFQCVTAHAMSFTFSARIRMNQHDELKLRTPQKVF